MKPNLSPAWNFLPPKAKEAVLQLDFVKPTPVQEQCLPSAFAGESFAAVAPTGTGKTLVYLLPIWNRLPSRKRNLVLVPTRELGYQVSQMLQAFHYSAREGIALCMGGHDPEAQRQDLRREWHTLIATPGRLLDVLGKDPDLLNHIRFLVLDEFDRLIDLGFEAQLADVLSHVRRDRQTLLFSATGTEDAFDRLPLGDLKRLTINLGKNAPLTECFYFLKSNRRKNDLLVELLNETRGQSIVFVANREKANHLNGLLRLRGFSSEALHGDRLQKERAQAYQGFKEGRFRVLVATDLAARGLDIPEVDYVVNYDLPRTFRDYIHRSGRTARRLRPGNCLSYAGPDEYLPMRNLEAGFESPLPCHPAYAQRDAWMAQAKRLHDLKTKNLQRAAFIRQEQGL